MKDLEYAPVKQKNTFELVSDFTPSDAQRKVVDTLCDGLRQGHRYQTLKGVTGSGKTYSMARVIERYQRPTLVLSHNKTLAAQLYREFKSFFPNNAVEYFVSYYDYYQPEAYVAKRDLYIEKDASINDEIDRLRQSATVSLMGRSDVIVVATVSCIYGLGSPTYYREMSIWLRVGDTLDTHELRMRLVELQYERNDDVLQRGRFRSRGEIIEIYSPAYDEIYRIELDWDVIASIEVRHPVSGKILNTVAQLVIYPNKHFVVPAEMMKRSIDRIKDELEVAHRQFLDRGALVEASRLQARALYDIEMLEEMGYCSGIENYSRHLSGRAEGERPSVLLDFFPDNFIAFIDESHVTLPQLRAMSAGDRARKQSLIEYGFRLPSARDNRPLTDEEFDQMTPRVIYVSATPGPKELERSKNIIEQYIRPTGLLDPEIVIHPTEGQIEHLYGEIRRRIERNERTLITTLTKKMAEDLADYLSGLGLRVRYMHSDIETIERGEILTQLRQGIYDVLVGINLLREGLDLPEVSLVAILDADKIGFLRSTTSLIQTIGRAARNVNGMVLMYADRISDAMRSAIDETGQRRKTQSEYNKKHGITPHTIRKSVDAMIEREKDEKRDSEKITIAVIKNKYNMLVPEQRSKLIRELEAMMLEHAKNWEFEEASAIRDEITELREHGSFKKGSDASRSSRSGPGRRRGAGRAKI